MPSSAISRPDRRDPDGTNGNIRNDGVPDEPAAGAVASASSSRPVPAGCSRSRPRSNNNRLIGYPVIKSGTVPLGTVIVHRCGGLRLVTGDSPRFEISDQATLHMEDTTPAHIGTAGTPAVVAAPARSMFQTDSMALRLILPMNWTLRRAGVVAWVAGVTW